MKSDERYIEKFKNNAHLGLVEVVGEGLNVDCYRAVQSGDLDRVKVFIDQGADVSFEDNAALRWAIREGNGQTVNALLPHARLDDNDIDILKMAVETNDADLVTKVASHIDPNSNASEAVLFALDQRAMASFDALLPHTDPRPRLGELMTSLSEERFFDGLLAESEHKDRALSAIHARVGQLDRAGKAASMNGSVGLEPKRPVRQGVSL